MKEKTQLLRNECVNIPDLLLMETIISIRELLPIIRVKRERGKEREKEAQSFEPKVMMLQEGSYTKTLKKELIIQKKKEEEEKWK